MLHSSLVNFHNGKNPLHEPKQRQKERRRELFGQRRKIGEFHSVQICLFQVFEDFPDNLLHRPLVSPSSIAIGKAFCQLMWLYKTTPIKVINFVCESYFFVV